MSLSRLSSSTNGQFWYSHMVTATWEKTDRVKNDLDTLLSSSPMAGASAQWRSRRYLSMRKTTRKLMPATKKPVGMSAE